MDCLSGNFKWGEFEVIFEYKFKDEEIINQMENISKHYFIVVGDFSEQSNVFKKLKSCQKSVILISTNTNLEFGEKRILINEKPLKQKEDIQNFLDIIEVTFENNLFEEFTQEIKQFNFHRIYVFFKYFKLEKRNEMENEKKFIEYNNSSNHVLVIDDEAVNILQKFFKDWEYLPVKDFLKTIFDFNQIFSLSYEINSEKLKFSPGNFKEYFYENFPKFELKHDCIEEKLKGNDFCIELKQSNYECFKLVSYELYYKKVHSINDINTLIFPEGDKIKIFLDAYLTDLNQIPFVIPTKNLQILRIDMEKSTLNIFKELFCTIQKFVTFLDLNENLEFLIINSNFMRIIKCFKKKFNKLEITDDNSQIILERFRSSNNLPINEYRDSSKKIFKRLSTDYLDFLQFSKDLTLTLENKFILKKDFFDIPKEICKSNVKYKFRHICIRNLERYKLWEAIKHWPIKKYEIYENMPLPTNQSTEEILTENSSATEKIDNYLKIIDDKIILYNFDKIMRMMAGCINKFEFEDDHDKEIYNIILSNIKEMKTFKLSKFYYINVFFCCQIFKEFGGYLKKISIKEISIEENDGFYYSKLSERKLKILLESIRNHTKDNLEKLNIHYFNCNSFEENIKILKKLKSLTLQCNCIFDIQMEKLLNIKNLNKIKFKNLLISKGDLENFIKKCMISEKEISIDCKIVEIEERSLFRKMLNLDKNIFNCDTSNNEFQKLIYKFCQYGKNKIFLSGKNIIEIFLRKEFYNSTQFHDPIHLDVKNLYLNKLPFTSEKIKYINSLWKKTNSIKTIYFQDNERMEYEDFEQIFTEIACRFGGTTENLIISKSLNKDKKMEHFLKELKNFTNLKKIDLSSNAINTANLEKFSRIMDEKKDELYKKHLQNEIEFVHDQNLEYLNLRNCCLKHENFKDILKLTNAKMKQFLIGNNVEPFDKEFLSYEGRSFKMADNLEELDLGESLKKLTKLNKFENLKRIYIQKDLNPIELREILDDWENNNKAIITLIDFNDLELSQKMCFLNYFSMDELKKIKISKKIFFPFVNYLFRIYFSNFKLS